MRLYYFTTEQFGIEAIRDGRLKISRINELNDPFEIAALALRGPSRREFRDYKNNMAKKFGIICMSRDWHHPLLWGHYADKHRGLCLGFDVADNNKFTEVEYCKERPTLNDLGCKSLNDLDESHMKTLLHMKFSAWEYESEYRAYTVLKEKGPFSELYFLTFAEDLKLAQVIVGERSSITRNRLAGILGESADTVTSFKARAGFQKFEVVENKFKKAWR